MSRIYESRWYSLSLALLQLGAGISGLLSEPQRTFYGGAMLFFCGVNCVYFLAHPDLVRKTF
jgi:hypothetical protein